MKKVALYLRLSEEDDDIRDESNSITSQRALLRKHFRSLKEYRAHELVEFKDDGFSGKTMERPGMQELLEHVKRGTIEAILVKDISRFSRDHLVSGRYLEQIFPFLGIRFISVNDNYDSAKCAGGIGEIDVAFKEILYDYYSEDLSVKVKSAMLTAEKNGKYVASMAPFGYRKDPTDRHKVLIDDESGKTVREIFRMAEEGKSYHRIARELNDAGVESPGAYNKRVRGIGGRQKHDRMVWYPNAVRKILLDEFYKGTYAFRKSEVARVGSREQIRYDRSEWLRITDHHEPLIQPDAFDRVQEILDKRSTKGKKVTERPKHMLVGKVICGCCGANMTHHGGFGGMIAAIYRCCRAANGTGSIHEKNTINDRVLEDAVFSRLKEEISRMADRDVVKASAEDILASKLGEIEQTVSEAEAGLEDIYRQQKESYEEYRSGIISKEEFLAEKERLEKLDEEIHSKLIEKRKAASEMEDEICARVNEDPLIGDTLEGWDESCDKLTKEMCDIFVDTVTVWPDGKVEINWRFADSNSVN